MPSRRTPPVRAADRALLLRRTPFGETSLVVHVLTSGRGRVELIARGAYRPKSRFSGVLDWFDTLELDWSRSDDGVLGTLRAGDVAVRRRSITRSLERYRCAQTVVELLDVATRAGAVDAPLFGLGEGALDALDAAPGPAYGALAAFELKLLAVLGLAPSLERCAACGQDAPPVDASAAEPRAPFSAGAGGRLCAVHANEAVASGRRVGTLPVDVLAAAAAALREPLGAAGPWEGGAPRLDERVLDFAGRFLDHHLETRPRSHRSFLAAADRNRRAASRTP